MRKNHAVIFYLILFKLLIYCPSHKCDSGEFTLKTLERTISTKHFAYRARVVMSCN